MGHGAGVKGQVACEAGIVFFNENAHRAHRFDDLVTHRASIYVRLVAAQAAGECIKAVLLP
jgi:hypothetical protein